MPHAVWSNVQIADQPGTDSDSIRKRQGGQVRSIKEVKFLIIWGPEKFHLDELFRRALAVWKDPREVVADRNRVTTASR